MIKKHKFNLAIKILSMAVLVLLLDSIVFAEVPLVPEATDSSDPFAAALPVPVQAAFVPVEQEETAIAPASGVSEMPQEDLSKFTVTGLVWGAADSKAIVNGSVVSVGDKIENAEIVKISREGLLLRVNGREVLVKR